MPRESFIIGARRWDEASGRFVYVEDRRNLALAELHKVFESYEAMNAGVSELVDAVRRFLRLDAGALKEGDGTHPNQMGPWS